MNFRLITTNELRHFGNLFGRYSLTFFLVILFLKPAFDMKVLEAKDFIPPPKFLFENMKLESTQNGNHLIVIHKHGFVIWDLINGKFVFQDRLEHPVQDHSLSPNGNFLILNCPEDDPESNSDDDPAPQTEYLSYWNLSQQKQIQNVSCEKITLSNYVYLKRRNFSLANNRLIISKSDKNHQNTISTENNSISPEEKNLKNISDLEKILKLKRYLNYQVSPDGKLIAFEHYAGIEIIELSTNRLVHDIKTQKERHPRYLEDNQFNFSPTGRFLYLKKESSIVYWDLHNNLKKYQFKIRDLQSTVLRRRRFILSDNEKWLANGTYSISIRKTKYKEGILSVWNMKTGELHYKEGIEDHSIDDLCFCLNGEYIATVGQENGITIKKITNPYIENREENKSKRKFNFFSKKKKSSKQK